MEDEAVPEGGSSRRLVAATVVSSAVATPATDVKPPADNLGGDLIDSLGKVG